jgi:phosphate transport system protein
MARNEFQQELETLRTDVVELGEVVLDRLRDALAALTEDDRELARQVADGDHEINERYLELESACIEVLALQQPVASDLRFVASSFKILTDLERIADLAGNLAAYVVSAEDGHEWLPAISVADLGTTAVEMVEDALAAYEDGAGERCPAIAERDDDLDGRCERAAQGVIRGLVDRAPTDDAAAFEDLFAEVSRLLLVVRDIERIGDHAVNIAARTLYMVESDDALIY